MRKLLEEAAKCFDNFRDVFNRLGQVSSSDSCIYMRDKITAALSEPEPDAIEILKKLLDLYVDYESDVDDMSLPWDEPARSQAERFYKERKDKFTSEATALIEAHGKRVPRAMLEKAYLAGVNEQCFFPGEHAEKFGYTVIGPSVTEADKHGVKVEDEE